MRLWSVRCLVGRRIRRCLRLVSRCRGGWRMPVWSGVSVRCVRLRIGQVIAVNDSVTCMNAVNLGTRTAPLVVEHRTGPDRNTLLLSTERGGL